MNEQKHIINRQVLELTIPERGRAQPIQNKISEIVKYRLQAELDNLFSKLTSANEIVRIDKLEIDVGVISEIDLEKFFVERSLREIGNEVNRLKISGMTNTGNKSVNGHSIKTNEGAATTSKSKDLLEQFVYFLQYGRFPWWHKSGKSSAKPGSSQLDEVFAEVLKSEIQVLQNSVVPLLNYPSVRKRLIYQFNETQLKALLNRINQKHFEVLFSMFQVLRSSLKSTPKRNNVTESFYKIALQYYGAGKELKNDDLKIGFVKDVLGIFLNKYSLKENEIILTEILKSINTKQRKEKPENLNHIVVAVVQLALELHSPNHILQKVIHEIEKSNSKVKNIVEQYKLKNRKSVNTKSTLKHNPTGEIKNKNEEKPFSLFSPKPADDAEGIVVSNAGLVMIHPFLKYFFDGLGLLDKEQQFKSQSDVFKAIHLLQYIVSETDSVAEVELPLNKILCGLDIAEPIPNRFPLLEEEKKECLNLISTVLERWDALKTSNPAALRDTYLRREGVLKQSGQSWSLTIERNSFDIMLEKLPWSINLIKLPWLSHILYVEW